MKSPTPLCPNRVKTASRRPSLASWSALFGELHCVFVIVEIDIPIWCCGRSAFDFGSECEHILEAIHVELRIRSEAECGIGHEVMAANGDILGQFELVDQDGGGFGAVFRLSHQRSDSTKAAMYCSRLPELAMAHERNVKEPAA